MISIDTVVRILQVSFDDIVSWLNVLDYEVNDKKVDVSAIEPILYMVFARKHVSDMQAIGVVRKIVKDRESHPIFSIINSHLLVVGNNERIFDLFTGNEIEFDGTVFTSRAVNVDSFASLIVERDSQSE